MAASFVIANRMNHFLLRICVFLAAIAFLFLMHLPASAEISPGLPPDYLEREFDWILYIDVVDVKHYLDYRGTKLHPLSKARARFKISRGKGDEIARQPEIYEELWYHQTTPIGMRRRAALSIPAGLVGAVVIADMQGNEQHRAVAANTALRAIVDLLLKKAPTGVLFASAGDYEGIAGALSKYGFSEKQLPSSGKQMSVTLRSYPAGRDDQLFLSH